MRPITRRRALQLGALGATSTAVGAWGLTRQLGSPGFTPVTAAAAVPPPVLASSGGELTVLLEAARRSVRVAGHPAQVLSYNATLPGPTLRVRAGDRLRLRLVNHLDAPTNLHTHGLLVSPQGHGDNPFVRVEPGRSFDHVIDLPADHPPGVYWYHPHHHGTVADQVFGGLYGAIVVADQDPDAVPVTRERVLVVSDTSLDASGAIRPVSAMERMQGREGDLVLVNGQHQPVLDARPGERERWRVVNACSSRYLRLRLDGQDLQLLGLDSGRLANPQQVEEVLLTPGNRADLLVTAAPGSSVLQALPYARGSMPGMGATGPGAAAAGPLTLATVQVRGDRAPALPPVAAHPAPQDLRGSPVSAHRDLTLGMGMGMGMGMGAGGMSFTIDGEEFDPQRTDHSVRRDTVEEWRIHNTTPMDHPFHLHTWPMQVLEQGGRPVQDVAWRDVVDVPADTTTTVRISFDRHVGRTVHHCHVLDHEDAGMMAVVQAR